MATLLKLTPTQALLLRAAARRADGRAIPTADLHGGARVKAVSAPPQGVGIPQSVLPRGSAGLHLLPKRSKVLRTRR